MKVEYKTKSRNVILEYLKENADRRFTAKDIIDAISDEGKNVNRTTIYRNLERLCQEGRLVRYKEADINAACYQYSEEHKACNEHIHAQCSECGKIFHLKNDIFKSAQKKMSSEYGIEIDYGKTVIIGTCNECRKKD